jgi:flagellar motility protein MotE (MotC chaperone)
MSLASKIQEQTKYSFVTQVDSALIETAYAEDIKEDKKDKPKADSLAKDISEEDSKPDLDATKQTGTKLETNLPNLQSGYSKEEMKILQELSNRRQALDRAEESLNMKANVLKATESKLEQKVSELKSLQDQVSELMKGYSEQEDAKYRSLVKIYENMKPREAANIFDELEMDMLVQIITRMKESRSAPIIAAMHPSKAKELSIELTKHKTLE